MSRERLRGVNQSSVLPRPGLMVCSCALERVFELCKPTVIPPLDVLLVPAAPASPSLRSRDKPIHLRFRLFIALLFSTLRGCLKEGVDRSINIAVHDCIVRAQLGLYEQPGTGFEDGRELRPQGRYEIRHSQRDYAKTQEWKRTAFQDVIKERHGLLLNSV
jgi:hypothetical protein